MEVHHIPAQFEGGLCLLYKRFGGVIFTGDTIMVSPSTGELTAWKNTPRQVPYQINEFLVIRERLMALDFNQLYASVRGEVRRNAKDLLSAFSRDYIETTAVSSAEAQRHLLTEERGVPESDYFFR